ISSRYGTSRATPLACIPASTPASGSSTSSRRYRKPARSTLRSRTGATMATAAASAATLRHELANSCPSASSSAPASRSAPRNRHPLQEVAHSLDAHGQGADAGDVRAQLRAGGLLESQLGDVPSPPGPGAHLLQPLQQGPELEGGEQAPDRVVVPLTHRAGVGLPIQLDVRVEPGDLLVQQELVPGVLHTGPNTRFQV